MCFKKGKKVWVRIGQLKKELALKMGIEPVIYFALIDWHGLQQSSSKELKIRAISKYPTVRRDLALLLRINISFSALQKVIEKAAGKYLQSVQLFDIFRDEEKLGKGLKSYAVALFFQDDTKTLTDKVVDSAMRKVVQKLERELGAKLR